MSSMDDRFPAETKSPQLPSPPPPIQTPTDAPYSSSSLPPPPEDITSVRPTRCVTGIRFLATIHGIFNIIIIVLLMCAIISAAAADDPRLVDESKISSSAKVSAFHTRNATLVFSAVGLFFVLLDTILHVTRVIYRFPATVDLLMIFLMLVLAVIFLILGCCAAAWEQKARDTLGSIPDGLQRKGAAAAASFFLFMAMIFTAIDFGLRLVIQPQQRYNP